MGRLSQRRIAELMGISTRQVRYLVHSMQEKGYGVMSDSDGMAKTDDRELKRYMAIVNLARANKYVESARRSAEGLIREDRGDLTEQENILWQILPKETAEWSNTSNAEKFEPIDINDLL